jgi:hypothetical protein
VSQRPVILLPHHSRRRSRIRRAAASDTASRSRSSCFHTCPRPGAHKWCNHRCNHRPSAGVPLDVLFGAGVCCTPPAHTVPAWILRGRNGVKKPTGEGLDGPGSVVLSSGRGGLLLVSRIVAGSMEVISLVQGRCAENRSGAVRAWWVSRAAVRRAAGAGVWVPTFLRGDRRG